MWARGEDKEVGFLLNNPIYTVPLTILCTQYACYGTIVCIDDLEVIADMYIITSLSVEQFLFFHYS